MMSENTVECTNLVCAWNYDGKCYDPCEEITSENSEPDPIQNDG